MEPGKQYMYISFYEVILIGPLVKITVRLIKRPFVFCFYISCLNDVR